ncbi:MAG: hypothetical protein ACYDBJ_24960 [Aggregatilineales bacterium]
MLRKKRRANVLNGHGALIFEPESELIRPIMHAGGWAVERYL